MADAPQSQAAPKPADAPKSADAPKKAPAARKPTAAKASASKSAAKTPTEKSTAKPGPKPAAARNPAAKTAAPRKALAKKPNATKAASKSAGNANGKWSTAAILGGVAAVGAAAGAALLALRGSSAVGTITETLLDKTGLTEDATTNHGTAHQADGTNSTASFQAGIADEGTIPS